jgi:hypothetical protein
MTSWNPDQAQRRFDALWQQQAALVDRGEWISGRPDLLGILGRQRRELDHCKVLAWLLDPRHAHGFRTEFLARFVRAVLPDSCQTSEVELASARVQTEVPRAQSRADIVVWLPSAPLVVEVKVDAGEGEDQCDRLVRDWGAAAHYAFLAPGRRAPATDTGKRFALLGFEDVRDLLNEVLEKLTGQSRLPGRSVAQTYLETLRHEYPRGIERGSIMHNKLDAQVRFYLEHRDALDDWIAPANRVPEIVHEFFLSAQHDLDARAPGLPGNPSRHNDFGEWVSWISVHLPTWVDANSQPLVSVGFGWERAEVKENLFGAGYVGVYAPSGKLTQQLGAGFVDSAMTRWLESQNYESGRGWPAFHYVPLPQRHFDDLSGFRRQIVDDVVTWWNRCWGPIDEVMRHRRR